MTEFIPGPIELYQREIAAMDAQHIARILAQGGILVPCGTINVDGTTNDVEPTLREKLLIEASQLIRRAAISGR